MNVVKVLVCFCCFVSHFSWSQNTYIPDDNFEQALINLGYDSVLDDFVLTANINSIASLDVESLNISDLTGIKDFTALENLYCGFNNLSSLDVSQNTNLTQLICNSNQLSEINITQNTSLINITCGNNLLTSVDITQNLVLESIDIRGCFLSALNVSQNSNLKIIRCFDNQITDLNVTQNPNLISFSCQNNELSTLNLSQNPVLNNINCSNNRITDLDFSQNPILEFVRCDVNLFSFLDLSLNTNLVALYCTNNPELTVLDLRNGNNTNIMLMQAFNNPSLECIYVDNTIYSNDNWTAIDSTSTFVESEAECAGLNCVVPDVDRLNDVVVCNAFVLPDLINGNYYTEAMSEGNLLFPGAIISSSQIIYIYNEDPLNPLCFNESNFEVSIDSTVEVEVFNDVSICDSYMLLPLTNGNYFTGTLGEGVPLFAEDEITTSQTIYIYAEDPNDASCYGESSFNITIFPEVNFNISFNNLTIEDQNVLITMLNPSIIYEYAIDDSEYQSSSVFSDLTYGFHELYVRDENHCVERSLTFQIIKPKEYYIPKFFTPNNDGVNDFWKVEDYKNVVNTISIYDRYGKLLAYLSPESNGWNGNFNGALLKNNDYWYVIKLHSGELIKGHFTLKR